MRDHRKLRAFELADSLALAIYKATTNYPKAEQYDLVKQMRRAAVSVPCNIVEGCAKPTEPDFLRYLDIAYGSCRELEYQISLSHRLGFLPGPDYEPLTALSEETGRVLHGLIRSLRKG